MRIGIDGHVLGKNIGGVERFVHELTRKLPVIATEHEYLVFVTQAQFSQLQQSGQKWPANMQFKPLFFANPLLERLLVLPWLVHRHKLDALLVQRLAPWFCGKCKLIVTIHDLTPIKFAAAYRGLSNHLVRLLTRNSIQRASLILTPTNTIRGEIQTYCPEARMPMVAFYNGVDLDTFNHSVSAKDALPISAPYMLTVGAIERRKNIETILHAMALMPAGHRQLAIVGSVRDQSYLLELKTLIDQLQLQDQVQFIGFIPESVLIQLYQHASLFITASRDEGFNIPPLEAMACGTPVLCSDIPVHRELFEGVVTFFATESAQDLSLKMREHIQDPSQSSALIEGGRARVHFYNWTQTAHNVAKAIQQIL